MIDGTGSGLIAGFVIDMFCTCMIDVANEFHIPTYVFFTSNAAFLGFELYIQTLCDDQNQDVIELIHSDTEVSVPCFVKQVPTKYMELEKHAIESLSIDNTVPPMYPVGPILNLEGDGKLLADDVISWLDSQPISSIVFVCFGSMGNFDEIQVKEIASALEQSGYRFVWSLRRPPSNQASRVPSDYDDPSVQSEGSCLIVGGTHCWRVCGLVYQPVAWPIYAEQQINAFEMVLELGLAVEIKLDYKRDVFDHDAHKNHTIIVTTDEIECGIRRLMEDNEVRTKVKEMSDKSRAAVVEGGSSYASVGRLIQDFMGNISGI
uniref:Anthocyanidin 3-O-glucosyltransferase 2-like n=1 Tax=Tanacetum cinerariifolium TaxID=118510 RepID=A0A6L2KD90_TANCI|nr:anthocyanidin 3-O-glucosyltransferase 2-like [Tanacetum cinerariifolium]